jgi:RimJ/RimL family protein N-acetyltransferase
MLLETSRLLIEPFNNNDVPDWAKIESDADVRRFIDGKALSLKEASEYIEINIRQYQTHGYGRYAVRLKENRTLIGMCGFLNEPYGIDFGYRYSKDSWGKGLGFEAAKEVLEYGFSELGLEKVLGLTAEQNYGSIRILEKLGFKFEDKFLFNNTKAYKYFYTRNS